MQTNVQKPQPGNSPAPPATSSFNDRILTTLTQATETKRKALASQLANMPPTIHLIRHAQGFHDTEPQALNKLIHDPELTPHGEQQCRAFRDAYPAHKMLQLVCASPLRRTLQTARLCLEPALGQSAPSKILALPDAQEVTDSPSDCGHPNEWLSERVGDWVDLTECERSPYWFRKLGRYAYEREALLARAKRLRRWLRDRPEEHIAVVSHGAYLVSSCTNASIVADQSRCIPPLCDGKH